MTDRALDEIAQIVRTMTSAGKPRSFPEIDMADLLAAFQTDGDGERGVVARGEAEGQGRAIRAAELALADLRWQLRQLQETTPALDPLAKAASR